ncbi:tRNA (guanosine(46)-N7)-methyltransferase TrmB [Sphaerochaeta sp. PS]|uniref:tRNA (guanosine(46)-N7)-methyltransferase TrmB n=1 Tax=Sphaerochaeta sp. PS TaxID=3076336 RepID=UPI0028A50938|nr:tRNA (guanosine(46)-N7)-methyltransferase TrmB [Sphaerochaeta sp. PS]MDT4762851.1 tRNA (guanosine(46)-N7)-methyltransferase TrmB [Sphaerochaeta sp. PS]
MDTIFDEIPSLATVETRELGTHRPIKSFVLRSGSLKPFQIEALRLYHKSHVLEFQPKVVDFKALFGNDKPLIIEIGFGMGSSTHRIAKERDEYNYLGLEVFLSGFAKLLSLVGKDGMENIRLMRFDAVDVLTSMIADSSVAGFHIFFPDPWQKKKHQKRRLIQEPLARLLANKLKQGGYIYCVTDWEEYAFQMVDVFAKVPSLVNPYGGFAPPRPWRPTTSFEQKGLAQEFPINEVWVEKI